MSNYRSAQLSTTNCFAPNFSLGAEAIVAVALDTLNKIIQPTKCFH
jgi:hypothetical protein